MVWFVGVWEIRMWMDSGMDSVADFKGKECGGGRRMGPVGLRG